MTAGIGRIALATSFRIDTNIAYLLRFDWKGNVTVRGGIKSTSQYGLQSIKAINIASAISYNQNALFVPCDHMLYVHDTSYLVYIASGSLSHVYIALTPSATDNVKFFYFPKLSYCPVIILSH